MNEGVRAVVEAVAVWLELAGVTVMVAGAVVAAVLFAAALRGSATRLQAYHGLRGNLGRSILLGLELLVAGDIIATILVEPSLEGVAALGLLVIIRTFLSFSLETEIEGRPPWRRNSGADQLPAEARSQRR